MSRFSALCVLLLLGCSTPSVSPIAESPPGSAEPHPLPPTPADSPKTNPRTPWFVVLDRPSLGALHLSGGVTTRAQRDRHLRALRRDHERISPRLKSLGAIVLGDLMRLSNSVLIMATPQTARRAARITGVLRVTPAPLHAQLKAESLPLVGAPELWRPVPSLTGEGVTVGIIDTGVDYTHAAFGGPGDSAAYQANDRTIVEPGSFPTAKVAGGIDLAGDAYDASSSANDTPIPDEDPLDCPRPSSSGHGTHVADTAAGVGVTLDGSPFTGDYAAADASLFSIFPGVAPRATLYAIKVFGCAGQSTTALTPLALEWASDPDGDGDFSDRLSVLNLSLGSTYDLSDESEAITSTLAALGTVIVAAAGNSGDNRAFFTTGTPGSHDAVISVANSQKTPTWFRSLHASGGLGPYALSEGRDTAPLSDSGPVTGILRRPDPADGCSPPVNASEIAGHIALTDRGGCSFNEKFATLEAAGALAVVVIDTNTIDAPFTMTGITTTLPGGLIRRVNGLELAAALEAGETVTVTLDAANYPVPQGPAYISKSSSRGPRGRDYRLKPDLAAPGRSINAAASGSGALSARMSGTSMASPHVAGAAALLVQQDPARTPLEIKALLMNAATRVQDLDGTEFPLSLSGAGLLDVAASAMTRALLFVPDPAVSLSFGLVTPAGPATYPASAILRNLGQDSQTYDLDVAFAHPMSGVGLTVSPGTITLGPGEETTLALSLTVDPAALPSVQADSVTPTLVLDTLPRHLLPEVDGFLVASAADATPIRLPFHAVVRPDHDRHAMGVAGCSPAEGAVTALAVSLTPPIGAAAPPLTSAFVDLPAAASGSLSAVGLALNPGYADSLDATPTLYVGIVSDTIWPLPGIGFSGVAGLFLDTDGDGAMDTAVDIGTEAVSDDGDERGVGDTFPIYIHATNQAASPAPLAPRVNVFAPDRLDTRAFIASAWVLPLPLAALGMTSDATLLGIQAWVLTEDLEYDMGATVYVDLTALPFNTTAHGIDHTPFITEDTAILTDYSAPLEGGDPPSLLLIHHTNAPIEPMERIALGAEDLEQELARISVSPPLASFRLNETADATITVTNLDSAPRSGEVIARFTGTPLTLAGVRTSGGDITCEHGAQELVCAFRSLGGQEALSIGLTLGADETGDATILAMVHTGLGCPAPLDFNETSSLVSVREPLDEPATKTGDNGCGCRTGTRREAPWLPLGLLMAALLVLRRRNP